jgi:hypothetical protein
MCKIDTGYLEVSTLPDGSTRVECTTPGCDEQAIKFFHIVGGTNFLVAACEYCATQLAINIPNFCNLRSIKLETLIVGEVMTELRSISYLAYTSGGHKAGH